MNWFLYDNGRRHERVKEKKFPKFFEEQLLDTRDPRGAFSEAALQRCFCKKVFEKCSKFTEEHPWQPGVSVKLQNNLLKSHFGMAVLL